MHNVPNSTQLGYLDLVPYAKSEDFGEVDGYVADGAVASTSSEESAPF